MKWVGTSVGQAKLAREAGLANNTVAAAHVALLSDLLCVGQALAWGSSKKVRLARLRAEFPVTDLLLAVAWSTERLRSVAAFDALPETAQGPWWEWLIAQELFRSPAPP